MLEFCRMLVKNLFIRLISHWVGIKFVWRYYSFQVTISHVQLRLVSVVCRSTISATVRINILDLSLYRARELAIVIQGGFTVDTTVICCIGVFGRSRLYDYCRMAIRLAEGSSWCAFLRVLVGAYFEFYLRISVLSLVAEGGRGGKGGS